MDGAEARLPLTLRDSLAIGPLARAPVQMAAAGALNIADVWQAPGGASHLGLSHFAESGLGKVTL